MMYGGYNGVRQIPFVLLTGSYYIDLYSDVYCLLVMDGRTKRQEPPKKNATSSEPPCTSKHSDAAKEGWAECGMECDGN